MTMRVVAGSARGVPLKGPPGTATRPTATRPTTDKVRGAIFDALALEVDGARVLDLYAGTGALGIEALSRGAASCLFVEKAAPVCRVIEANLRATKLAAQGAVWCANVETVIEQLVARRAPRAGALSLPPKIIPPSPSGRAGQGGEGSLDSTFLPPYDVIILDPPYGDPAIVDVIERLGRSALPARGGLVVLEHGKRVQPPAAPGALRPRRVKRYGDTVVTIWQREEDAEV